MGTAAIDRHEYQVEHDDDGAFSACWCGWSSESSPNTDDAVAAGRFHVENEPTEAEWAASNLDAADGDWYDAFGRHQGEVADFGQV